jgi:hypothetical protein
MDLGPDVEILMLNEVLDILDIFFHRDRFVGGTQFFHEEGLGVVFRFRWVDVLPLRVGIGYPLEDGLALLDEEVAEPPLVTEKGGGYSGRAPADDDDIINLVHVISAEIRETNR